MRLNLGCSDRLEIGFVNIDITEPADEIVDLSITPWPWDDSSVDEIRAWDIFEHLPRPVPPMNESWRILKSGGILDLIVPTTDGRGWAQDPTHICMPPWNRNSLFYYEHENPHLTRFAPANGVLCAFTMEVKLERCADNVEKMHAIMRAVK